MSRRTTSRVAVALPLALFLVLGRCAAAGPAPQMKPFASDGCSMFPDRAPVGKADWCACCAAHDLAYWRGGSADERLRADEELERCVRAATGDAALSKAMLAGVRAGGAPYFPVGYRWGYGWPYGRAYTPLSNEEQAQAERLRAQYTAEHPADRVAPACRGTDSILAGR